MNQKKEIPILFSTPMVKAILAGRKTQTRRIIKDLPEKANDEMVQIMVSGHHNDHGHAICRYGKPGDILWVRESIIRKRYGAYWNAPDIATPEYSCEYVAGGTSRYFNWLKPVADFKHGKIIPSIHTYQCEARIWLQVEEVAVQRLQDIDSVDSIDEGVMTLDDGWLQANFSEYYAHHLSWVRGGKIGKSPIGPNPIQRFKALWMSINGPESWEANPWLWVVKFKVLSTDGRPAELGKDSVL